MSFISVGVGGFFGAISRYWISILTRQYVVMSFPYATLAVNVFGCLLIGWFLGYSERFSDWMPTNFVLLGTVGFLGSFTTFSTFGLETFQLIRNQSYSLAAINIMANLLLGLNGVLLGYWLATK